MIEIKNKKNKFTYNVYHVTKAFFPEEEIVQTVDEEQEYGCSYREELAFPLQREV